MIGYSWLIYGDIRVGKTWLAITAPGPRLYLDVENRSDTIPGKVVKWDGKNAFPEVDKDTTVVVKCQRVQALSTVITWIKAGKLKMVKSLILDSGTMLQQNEIDETFNGEMGRQEWGRLLKMLSPPLRTILLHCKDEKTELEAVVVNCWLKEYKVGEAARFKPAIDGQLQSRLAHLTDTVGFLFVKGQGQTKKRVLQVEPTNGVTAGSSYATLDKYNGFIDEPNIEKLNAEIRKGSHV